MKRQLKNYFKRLMYKGFVKGQNAGFNILPNHFYSQVPHISSLKKETQWRTPMSMFGILGADVSEQLNFIKSICTESLKQEIASKEIFKDAVKENGEDAGYGVIEADILYCFIKSVQPKKIIQVGCGVSTAIILRAATEAGYTPEIVCIEPFPMPFLTRLHDEKKITLVKEKAQNVPLEVMTDLPENGFFFVDSTHTVKPGSEVNKIILEILPRLQKNVWVHFHDIYFPYDYKRNLLSGDLFFWLESTMLHAFLINNPKYRIMASLSMLHYSNPGELKNLIPKYDPETNDDGLKKMNSPGSHFPSSIYLRSC